MKLYLAAPYSRKDEIKGYAEQLRAVGIEVTSSWLDEPHKPTTQMQDLPHEVHQGYAVQDVQDVLAGEGMVFFTDPTKSIVRQGRTAEFGMAVMMNQLLRPTPIFVVGEEYENIFHHLPNVLHFATFNDVLIWLCEIRATGNTLANWMHNFLLTKTEAKSA